MTEVKIELIGMGRIPTRGTDYAAAYDLYARRVDVLEPGLVSVQLGIATQFPAEFRAVIHARSSISPTGWMLANGVGIVDSDYRGEWRAYFNRVVEDAQFPYAEGHRVAQFYLEKIEPVVLVEVEELEQSGRGAGGFGSTGK